MCIFTQYCFGVLPINFVLDFETYVSCPGNAVTVFIMFSMIFLVPMNLTGYVQCILCVDSLVDILVHQSGTFFVLWYFDCSIDCIVLFFFLSVCLSVCLYTSLCEIKIIINNALDWLQKHAAT